MGNPVYLCFFSLEGNTVILCCYDSLDVPSDFVTYQNIHHIQVQCIYIYIILQPCFYVSVHDSSHWFSEQINIYIQAKCIYGLLFLHFLFCDLSHVPFELYTICILFHILNDIYKFVCFVNHSFFQNLLFLFIFLYFLYNFFKNFFCI